MHYFMYFTAHITFKYKLKSPQEIPKQTAGKALYTSPVPYTGHPQTEY